MSKKLIALAALALSAVSAPAFSASVTWEAKGTINPFTFNLPSELSWLDGGDRFSFVFEAVTPATTTNILGSTYQLASASILFTDSDNASNSKSYSLLSANFNDTLRLRNGGSSDGLEVSAQQGNFKAAFNLFGGTTLIASQDPTFTGVNVGAATITWFRFWLGEGEIFPLSYVPGTVESVAPVPLPAAAWLLLSGLAGVAAFARRRRRAPDDSPAATA